jgi:hypothetical protein
MDRHPDLAGRAPAVAAVLAQKCAHAGIDVPTAETMRMSPFREELEREWENMLGHQLPKPLPPFAVFWATLDEAFAWLAGEFTVLIPPRIEQDDRDPAWLAPQGDHVVAPGLPLRAHPIRGGQPPEGRPRVPRGER